MGPRRKITDYPYDFKDAIDWILRIAGEDGGIRGRLTELTRAIAGLNGFQTVKDRVLGKHIDLHDLIAELANGLKEFIGYDGDTGSLSGRGIGGASYMSTYDPDKGWNTVEKSNKVTDTAKHFLHILPLVYYTLTYLYWKCTAGVPGSWATHRLGDSAELSDFMKPHGFDIEQLNGDMKGSDVATALGGFAEFEENNNALSYTHFIRALLGLAEHKPHCVSFTALIFCASSYYRSKDMPTLFTLLVILFILSVISGCACSYYINMGHVAGQIAIG
ncbi:variant erythrocyte surface antigen-1 family protein [Babesia caballi]|uniref:Variant erythrocyte surface antigen-1 family protein n=1 Tax=Babesia caballi TaxID=5871 RepID=A0AAV4LZT4_BABCB|nr:variant erythrocyte surface antigen-1 family protein [Babesia caballi]